MPHTSRTVIIVDGYSAGNLLAPEITGRGASAVHVQTTAEIWPVLRPSFHPEDYAQLYTYTGNLEALCEALSRHQPSACLAGTETGVELADRIAERLGLRGNGTQLSAARRNKYLMGEAVRAAGIAAVRQLLAVEAEQALQWKHSHHLDEVIVKPVHSAGTDSVSLCRSDDEVRVAFAKIFGTTNRLGIFNDAVLVQEVLRGTEYFLNTISCDGDAFFTEIWEYQKRNINQHDCVYDNNRLLPHDGEVPTKLRKYVLEVLRALGIRWGAAHTEVMLTERGPVLVELGARLDGLSVPAVNQAAIGFSALELLVDLYLDPAAYAKKTRNPFALKAQARTVYLTSYQAGTVVEIPGEKLLRALPGFFQLRLRAKPGSTLVPTVDYFTAPGFLTLIHPSAEQIETDLAAIRQWEKSQQIFRVEPCV